ncbi:YheV family putative metal-binding protein [Halomarina pelagica]|nr:YheV family putative metal-binding protein [Halomarina sp. BND7]
MGRKRHICPDCSEPRVVVLIEATGEERRECAECGWRDFETLAERELTD